MANPEACELWIEQRTDELLATETNFSEIGRIISTELYRLFEARISEDAIRKRASRRTSRTNVQGKSKTQKNKPLITQSEPLTKPRGKPASAGRPQKVTFNETNENIEWAKWTWNPVTGCKHECPYCYARDIANRFYSQGFKPTFHPNRLTAPKDTVVSAQRRDEPGINNVFVCSMADLFGEWVPQEWIDKTLAEVRRAPQWNFLFLTKNPVRLVDIQWPDNVWVGTTVDIQKRVKPAKEAFKQVKAKIRFLSCEPLMEKVVFKDMSMFDWLIVGGRSASSKMTAGQPEWIWVESLLTEARYARIPIYFKPNLTVRPKEYPKQQSLLLFK